MKACKLWDMPIKVGKKRYKTFAGAERAAKKKGVSNPGAYVASIERKQGINPRTGRKQKKK